MENDLELEYSCWLKFNMADLEHVTSLECSICPQFCAKLESIRNFKPAFNDGSSYIHIYVVKDHAATDMHAYKIHLLKKQPSLCVVDYKCHLH